MGICKTSRPDCQVEVRFKVHDVPGAITDSSSILLNQALTRFIREELEGFDIEMEFTPVEEEPIVEDYPFIQH